MNQQKTCTAILMAAALPLVGCSYGLVRDADTGSNVGGAVVRSQKIATGSAYGAITFTGSPVEITAWDGTSPGSGPKGMWYLNAYGPWDESDTTPHFLRNGWTRFEVKKAGYDTRVLMTNHQYGDCDVPLANPVSGGSYAYETPEETVEGLCKRQDFSLHQSTVNYTKDPDLIVDVRQLRDWQYVTERGEPHDPEEYTLADDCEGASDTCIRVSVGTANVGVGDLYVTAPLGAQNQITQHRYNRLSGVTDTALDGSFISDGHPHLHLAKWTQIRLRQIDSTCEDESTAENCPILPTTGRKVSFCLLDSLTYDTSADLTVYQSNRGFSGCDVVENGLITQGISAGHADVYGKYLAGQFVPADGLHGQFWLEVEVNPITENGKRTVLESDYTNNVSRVKITIP